MELSASQAEAWVSSLAARADGLLGELEAAFGERPVESLAEGELEAVTGNALQESPVDAQELFLSALVKKVTKVAKGVAKVAGKGISAVGKLLPLGKLFGVLRKLVRPLLQRVLARAIGKLPPPALRPLATKLAGRLAGSRHSRPRPVLPQALLPRPVLRQAVLPQAVLPRPLPARPPPPPRTSPTQRRPARRRPARLTAHHRTPPERDPWSAEVSRTS